MKVAFFFKFYRMHIWEINELKKQIGIIMLLNRLRLNLSQFLVANELNLSANQIGRIERAETNPTLSILLKLSNFYSVELSDLFVKITESKVSEFLAEIEKLKEQNKKLSD